MPGKDRSDAQRSLNSELRFAAASTVTFAANLLGAMVGGILEYSSLIYGCAYFFSSGSPTSGPNSDSISVDAPSAPPMPAPESIGL